MNTARKTLSIIGLLVCSAFATARAQDSAAVQSCDHPHTGAYFRAGCRGELGRLMSSKLAGDWTIARATNQELDTATSLAAFDSAWVRWEPRWKASNINPKDDADKYFQNTFSPRSYAVYNAARNDELERIVSHIKATRKNQSFAEADSSLLTSRCFDQLDLALDSKDSEFAVRLALSHAKECTARLYDELRAAHQ